MAKCVIYKLYFNDKEKFYIGSSINFRRRFIKHKSELKNKVHVNRHLQNAWNKYKVINYEILEECNNENILDREQFYIDTLKPHYNICLEKVNNRLGSKHSKETLEKMSISQKNSWTEEKRQRVSAVRKGMMHNFKNRKIDLKKLALIRKMILEKIPNKEIANTMGVATSTISRIKTNKIFTYAQ